MARTNRYLSKTDKRLGWLLVFLLFSLTNPYFFWNLLGNFYVKILVFMLGMLIFWKYSDKRSASYRSTLYFYILLFVIFIINEYAKGARLGVVSYLPYVMIGFVPLVKKHFGLWVFHKFATIYAIIIGLSMISWIAALMGLLSPIGQLGEGNETLEMQRKIYLVYPLSLVLIRDTYDVARFCGIFDEPGVVGTLGGLILCALRFNIKDWRCVVVLLSGFLSTSMFFYGVAAVYWLSELIFVKKNYKLMLLIMVGIIGSYLLTRNNHTVSVLVWNRFEWNSEIGGFAGNTRETEGTTLAMKRMRESGEIWLGVKDKNAYWKENFGSSSIYNVIAMYGIIVVTLYIVWLLRVGFHYKVNNWDYLLYCFVIIGCMYQRTNLFSLPYTFLFVCVARYYEYRFPNSENPKEVKTG